MSLHQSKYQKVTRLKVDGTNYQVAAGTTDLTSEAVDTANFESNRFIIGFGTITAAAVTSIKVQQCDTSGGTYEDLAGSAITVADTDDNFCKSIEIAQPRKRFLKFFTDRGTQNAVVDFLLLIQGGAKKLPIADDTTTAAGSEVYAGPAAGTA